MKSTAFFSALVAILPAYVNAQAQEWGQCGGIGWSELHSFRSQTFPTNILYSRCNDMCSGHNVYRLEPVLLTVPPWNRVCSSASSASSQLQSYHVCEHGSSDRSDWRVRFLLYPVDALGLQQR